MIKVLRHDLESEKGQAVLDLSQHKSGEKRPRKWTVLPRQDILATGDLHSRKGLSYELVSSST